MTSEVNKDEAVPCLGHGKCTTKISALSIQLFQSFKKTTFSQFYIDRLELFHWKLIIVCSWKKCSSIYTVLKRLEIHHLQGLTKSTFSAFTGNPVWALTVAYASFLSASSIWEVAFLPGVKLQSLRELRVVVVMWCFFLHEHLTETFAKQLLYIWEKYELLLF